MAIEKVWLGINVQGFFLSCSKHNPSGTVRMGRGSRVIKIKGYVLRTHK